MTANQPPENNVPQPPPAGPPQTPPPASEPDASQPPAEPKKKSALKRFLIIMVGAVVAIVVGIMVRSGVFDSPSMKVGDCVQQVGEDDVKVVDCASTDAQYSVLGIVEKQSQMSARMGACKEFPETTSVYWQGRNNSNGTVYCLKRL